MKEKERIADYAEEILASKNKIILVKADVGSGKTWFANNYLPNLGKTQSITSRAVIKHQSYLESLNTMSSGAVSTPQQKSADSTLDLFHQWDIQQYFSQYRGSTSYKYIVIDEIHSLLSDTFADSAFYMAEFIKSIPSGVCLIMMSACADRVKDFLEIDMDLKVDYIDFTDRTVSVKPKKVMTIMATQAKARLTKVNSVNRMLYFCATTKEAYSIEADLLKLGIRAVAITSQPENRPDQDLQIREEKTLQYLYHHDKYPEDVDVIITTSKLREGLNLHDTRIKTIISELKDHVSLIQCAGSVRHGVEEFCLVKNRGNNPTYISEDKLKSACEAVKGMNAMISVLDAMPQESELYKRLTAFDSIKEKYGGLVVLFDNRFHVNKALIRECQYRKKESLAYKENPEKYISSVMGMPVNPAIDLKAIEECLASHIGKKLNASEKKDLLIHLNEMGLEGKQLDRMLDQTRFRYKHAPNYSWHMILFKRKSGFSRIPQKAIYNHNIHSSLKLVSKRVS